NAAGGPGTRNTEREGGEAAASHTLATEQRDCDDDEANVRHLHVGTSEPELPAENVECSGQSREQPGDRHREDEVPRDADPAVPRSLGIEADRAHLVPERRTVEDDVEGDQGAQ